MKRIESLLKITGKNFEFKAWKSVFTDVNVRFRSWSSKPLSVNVAFFLSRLSYCYVEYFFNDNMILQNDIWFLN